MEGDNCHAIRTDLAKTTNDELHDSGCEQSPTAPSPDRQCSPSEKSELSRVIKTYDREFLLSRQFTPHALNPDPEELLCAKYVQKNGGGYGIFDAKRCYYTKSDIDKLSSLKEIQPEYFKNVHEEMLRPQRKSFGSGCQMRNGASSESADKIGSKSNGLSQRRGSESSDSCSGVWPRSVPAVERKIGSGRLGERSDSRGSADRGVTGREKPPRIQTSADKFSNWRQQHKNEELIFMDDRRPSRDGKDHRSGYNSSGYRKQDAVPEWMMDSIKPGDTIELKGFDGHQDKIDRKERKEKEKKKKAESRITQDVIEEDVTADLANTLTDDSEPLQSIDAADLDKTDTKFDFDAFMSKQTGQTAEVIPESPSSSAATTASRFSRWFKQEDGGTTSYEPLKLDSPLSIPSASRSFHLEDELNNDDHWNSVVSKWILPAGLDDEPSPEMNHDQPSSGGNKILELLQGAFESSKTDQQKAKEEPEQLPAALTQLLNTAATDPKPHLPTTFKTVEELEAPLAKPETVKAVMKSVVEVEHAVTTSGAVASHSNVHTSESAASNSSSSGSMAAFDKLVGMLQGTGELHQPIPKMPEVTNKETPNQLKKLLEPQAPPSAPSMYQERQTDDSPLLNSVRPRQSAASVDSGRPVPLMPTQHQMGSSSPASALNSLPANMLMNQAMMPGMPPPVVPNPLAALQGATVVNPLLQHTIQQRQNPSSPIMFGAQPPVHIVAPAPIHPASPGHMPHLHQAQVMRGQSSMPLTNPFNSAMSNTQSAAKPSRSSTSVSSMAFTPTSVMRKRANDKVDGRHKQAGDSSSGHELNVHNNGHNSPQSMRPIVKGMSSANQHAREDNGSQVEKMRSLVDMLHPPQQAMPQLNMFQQQFPSSQQQLLSHMYQPMTSVGSMNGFYQQPQMAPPAMMSRQPPFNLQQNGSAPSLDSMHHLAAMQQAHQPQHPLARTMLSQQPLSGNMAANEKSDITKWFCGAELNHQSMPILPNHANMLTLDDIEH